MSGKFLILLRVFICLFLLQIAPMGAAQAKKKQTQSSVTIPLQDYLKLIEKDKKELSFSSVESVNVTGAYGKELNITFKGSSSTNPKEVVVMGYNNNYSISSCQGSAALSLRSSEVVLFPQAKKFTLNCKMKVNNWQNLRFKFKKVLAANINVTGAEAIYKPGSAGEKNFSVFPKDRQVASANQPPSFVSRYHLTLLKGENRFKYTFQLENPNKQAKDYTFKPRGTEIVKSVNSRLRYKEKDGAYHFVLPPGSSTFTVVGRFNGGEWSAPIESGLSYLLIDQHPMITSKITTGAKRVSKSAVGIWGKYPVAKAYMVSQKDQFVWEKSELEAFTAATYTIDSANYDYYWAKSGQDLVEATYYINNQGASEIPLKVPGTPTFLSINGQAQVLTKTKEGDLLLNVPTGTNQTVKVQYKVDNSKPRVLASINSALPKPDATVSSAHLSLQLPKSHQPFFFKNGDDWQFFLDFPRIFTAILLFMFVMFFLTRAGFERKLSLYIASGIGLLSLYFYSVFSWAVFAILVSFILANRHRFEIKGQFTWKKLVGGFAVVCMIAIVGTFVLTLGVPRYQSFSKRAEMQRASHTIGSGYASGTKGNRAFGGAVKKMKAASPGVAAMDEMELSEAIEEDSFDAFSDEAAPADNYQGLPAKIQIPREGRYISMQQGFTEAKNNLKFTAFSFNGWILKLFNYSLLLFCLITLWRERKKLLVFTKLDKLLA